MNNPKTVLSGLWFAIVAPVVIVGFWINNTVSHVQPGVKIVEVTPVPAVIVTATPSAALNVTQAVKSGGIRISTPASVTKGGVR